MIQFIHDSDKELFQNAMNFAQKQVTKLIDNYPDFYPMYTVAGKWKHEGAVWTHWCDGFLPGMMWIFAKYLARKPVLNGGASLHPEYKFWFEKAIHYSKPLEHRKSDNDVHDLGFIFLSTYHPWFKLT